jgi:hypothetical protein
MSEQTTTDQQVGVVENQTNPFAQDVWSENAPTPKVEEKPVVVVDTQATSTPPPQEAAPVEEDEIIDPNEWLKRTYGVDNPDVIKQEREELQKLRASKPEELKFENEDSKRVMELLKQGKIKDVVDIYSTQEQLNKYTTGEVTKDTAANIIKLGMQLSNKLLTSEDIDFKYNQDYGIPRQPVQKDTETEEDFAERMEVWNERVKTVEMKKIIDAKMAIPQLEQLKTKIVFPEMEKPQQINQEPQVDVAALQKIRDNFLQLLESNYSKVEGYSTLVKDESVEIPIQFKIPDDQKLAIKGRLEQGMKIDDYIGDRWFDANGTPKIDQIIMDIFELENRDKVHAGIANAAANKRLEEYIKSAKQIDIHQTPQQTAQVQNGNQNVSPFSQGAWSEKPPSLINN